MLGKQPPLQAGSDTVAHCPDSLLSNPHEVDKKSLTGLQNSEGAAGAHICAQDGHEIRALLKVGLLPAQVFHGGCGQVCV